MKGQNLGSYFLILMALHMTFKIKIYQQPKWAASCYFICLNAWLFGTCEHNSILQGGLTIPSKSATVEIGNCV